MRPCALGRRHALHAMHAGLPAHRAVRRRHQMTLNMTSLMPPSVASDERHDLDAPAVPLAEARVHAVEVGGEQRGLVAAGAGADLDDRVAVVERIARHAAAA